jgi:tetratricopeptide (TPR) repeat protein
MAKEKVKTTIIIVLCIAIFGIGVFALTRSKFKSEKPVVDRTERTLTHGPIVDSGTIQNILPLEQLDVDSKDPVALASLGDRYFEGKNFQQATEIYKKVLELNPNDVDTYNDLGLAQHYSGKTENAIETLTKGTEVVPSYQRIWLSLGFVYASTGREFEAKPALKKAVELGPDTTIGKEAQRILGLLK